jgi:hypothetical protein
MGVWFFASNGKDDRMAARKEGKWERFVAELPKLPAGVDGEKRGNAEYMARVEQKKAEYAGKGASGLAAEYREARLEKDATESLLGPINLRIAALAGALEETFSGEGLHSLKLEGGASIGVNYEPYASVEDKAAYMAWLFAGAVKGFDFAGAAAKFAGRPDPQASMEAAMAEHLARTGFGPLLSLPWQTLNTLLKESLEEGVEPPPGVKAYMLPKVSLRGAK